VAVYLRRRNFNRKQAIKIHFFRNDIPTAIFIKTKAERPRPRPVLNRYIFHLIYLKFCVCCTFVFVVKGPAADATEAPQP
jgi:hypothetical protein